MDSLQLPYQLDNLVRSFAAVPDPKLRYQQLLFFARKLPEMDAALKTEENLVRGCQSVVHVHVEIDDKGLVRISADSDAQLTRGLVAMLVRGLDGCTPEEVLRVDGRFIAASGLAVSLTPARNNGFASALAKVKERVLKLQQASNDVGSEESVSGNSASGGSAAGNSASGNGASGNGAVRNEAGLEAAGGESVVHEEGRPLYSAIMNKLAVLKAEALDVIDESAKHAGHVGTDGRISETHFAISVVSDAFASLKPLQRHRLIYTLLKDEVVPGKVHALRIDAKTPSEASA